MTEMSPAVKLLHIGLTAHGYRALIETNVYVGDGPL